MKIELVDLRKLKYTFGWDYMRKLNYLFRIVVVTCSVLATVYYGYECAKKYISDPITVSEEMVPLDSLPPLQWSICKQVYLTDCTIQAPILSNFFDIGTTTMNATSSIGK